MLLRPGYDEDRQQHAHPDEDRVKPSKRHLSAFRNRELNHGGCIRHTYTTVHDDQRKPWRILDRGWRPLDPVL